MIANTTLGSKIAGTPRLAAKNRILTVDALRGAALLLMALHHTAIFGGTYFGAETYNNRPFTPETWPHWVSGLITHIAAPTFWLLGGVSIALFENGRRQKGDSEWVITRFLLTRAALIILLDLTLGDLLWPDNLGNTHVLISLAISIALLSVARLLPIRIFIALTISLLVGYQWLLGQIATQLNQPQGFWQGLWLTNSLDQYPALEFPILGWVTVMALGFVLGRQLSLPGLRQAHTYLVIGLGLLGLWLGLRWIGGYGDLDPYVVGDQWYYFFEMSKSPPSLTYQAFYIGLSMFILAAFYTWIEWLNTALGEWLVTIGQVSLFFFLIHPAIYRPLTWIFLRVGGYIPAIVSAYLVWLFGFSILIPLAWAYRQLRRSHPNSLLKYL